MAFGVIRERKASYPLHQSVVQIDESEIENCTMQGKPHEHNLVKNILFYVQTKLFKLHINLSFTVEES
jgi:hypothetical protein